MSRPALLALVALAGCSFSSLDDEIFPTVVSATVAVDASAPDALAPLRVRLELRGGPSASAPALLDKVTLATPGSGPIDEGAELLRLELAFPAAFDAYVHESQVKTVDLENTGTLSSDLEPLCGQSLILIVSLADADEPGAGSLASTPVTVTCP